jgi:hypothetical protein
MRALDKVFVLPEAVFEDREREVIVCSKRRYPMPVPSIRRPPKVTVLAFWILITGRSVNVLRERHPAAQANSVVEFWATNSAPYSDGQNAAKP